MRCMTESIFKLFIVQHQVEVSDLRSSSILCSIAGSCLLVLLQL